MLHYCEMTEKGDRKDGGRCPWLLLTAIGPTAYGHRPATRLAQTSPASRDVFSDVGAFADAALRSWTRSGRNMRPWRQTARGPGRSRRWPERRPRRSARGRCGGDYRGNDEPLGTTLRWGSTLFSSRPLRY